MEYLDFDLEVEATGRRDYRVAVRSPEGDTHQPMHFPFEKLELENAVLKLQNALLKSGGQHRDAVLSPEAQAVQDFGQRLFETLLSGNVRALYDACRTRAAREGRQGVRLRLRIQAADLAALPWEYLYDARRGEYLCLSRRTPLIRYPEVAQPIQPLSITPPLRILAMIASPSDQPQLKVTNERDRLERALADLEARGLVKLSWLEGQTWRDLQRAMRGGPWHVFHFIGHGGFHPQAQEGVLALANEEGTTHLLGATQFAYLLANHDTLRLALLNACEGATGNTRDLFSSTAATLARRGIPAVLAMQYAITDRAAMECSRAFYEALADGLPVDAALGEARAAIHIEVNNSLEWGTPVLYLRAPDGVLFTLSGQPQPPPAPTKTAGNWVEEGMQHALARRYSEALAAFEQAIQRDPGNAAAQFGKGNALWNLERRKEARTVYELALPLEPHDATAYQNKSRALANLGRYEEALATSGRAIQLDPTNGDAYRLKGHVLTDLGRYEEALPTLERAIQLDPTNAFAYHLKGHTLANLQRYEEALPAYERAIQLDPTNVLAYSFKGSALASLRREEEALAAYERAIQLDPTNALAYSFKGSALADLQRYEEALVAYARAIQLDPTNAYAYHNKGQALADLQRYEEALATYEQTTRLDPTNALAYHDKGWVLSQLDRYKEALVAFERAIQLDPTSADAHSGKGAALIDLQRYEEALVAFERAIQLDPTAADAYANKGYVLTQLGRTAEAEQAYKKARALGFRESRS